MEIVQLNRWLLAMVCKIFSSGKVRSNLSKIVKTDDVTGGTREKDRQGWLRAVRVRVRLAELIS